MRSEDVLDMDADVRCSTQVFRWGDMGLCFCPLADSDASCWCGLFGASYGASILFFVRAEADVKVV